MSQPSGNKSLMIVGITLALSVGGLGLIDKGMDILKRSEFTTNSSYDDVYGGAALLIFVGGILVGQSMMLIIQKFFKQ